MAWETQQMISKERGALSAKEQNCLVAALHML
jgi:hypothetical protein